MQFPSSFQTLVSVYFSSTGHELELEVRVFYSAWYYLVKRTTNMGVNKNK